jgi:hypothetical protein
MNFSDRKVVTHDQLTLLGNLFGESIDVCYLKLTPTKRDELTRFLWNMFLSYKIREMFTSKHLSSLGSQLYADVPVNEFIQELTTNFGIVTAAVCSENSESLEKTIAVGLVGNALIPTEDLVSFTPKVVLDNMEHDPEVIYKLLISNRWLTTIVMVIMYFQKSQLWLKTSDSVYTANNDNKTPA